MEHTENKTIIHDTEKTASWEQQTAMKVSGISILVNLLLSVFKLIAGIVAHSGAMISDAIHSASDVGKHLHRNYRCPSFYKEIGQRAPVRT